METLEKWIVLKGDESELEDRVCRLKIILKVIPQFIIYDFFFIFPLLYLISKLMFFFIQYFGPFFYLLAACLSDI